MKKAFKDMPAVRGKNRPEGRKQRVYVWITVKEPEYVGVVQGMTLPLGGSRVMFRRAW